MSLFVKWSQNFRTGLFRAFPDSQTCRIVKLKSRLQKHAVEILCLTTLFKSGNGFNSGVKFSSLWRHIWSCNIRTALMFDILQISEPVALCTDSIHWIKALGWCPRFVTIESSQFGVNDSCTNVTPCNTAFLNPACPQAIGTSCPRRWMSQSLLVSVRISCGW